jgi:hypothetical protein
MPFFKNTYRKAKKKGVGILIYFKHGGYSTEDDGQASS